MNQRRRDDYQVGWICALALEAAAVRLMLDKEHERPHDLDKKDVNAYTFGNIGQHNIVIAVLPQGNYGTISASSLATQMLRTFPKSLRFGLLVGIGGGIPSKTDIRLGDVVVSAPDNDSQCGGVIQHDRLKVKSDGNHLVGSLNGPPTILLNAVANLKSRLITDPAIFLRFMKAAMTQHHNKNLQGSFARPAVDRLFMAEYEHPTSSGNSCAKCEPKWEQPRSERSDTTPVVHYGIIASGNQLVKDSRRRDDIRDQTMAICIETEAAGLMQTFPCLVIRGICDYADSHKNDQWQPYAALSAASYAKELLLGVPSYDLDQESLAADTCAILNRMSRTQAETKKLAIRSNVLAKQQLRQSKAMAAQVRTSTASTMQQIREARALADMTKKVAAQEEANACMRSFFSTYVALKDENPQRLNSTCEWVLNHQRYTDWIKSSARSILLISADPGCGKSVLARSLVDKDIALTTNTLGIIKPVICYYFFKDNDERNTLCGALSAVLHQIFTQRPRLLYRYALPVWKKMRETMTNTQQLWNMLQAVAADTNAHPVYCVLDALDECRREDQAQLISLLAQSESKSIGEHRLKIVITTRPCLTQRAQWLSAKFELADIQLDAQEVIDDMRREISHVVTLRMGEIAKDLKMSDKIRDKWTNRLMEMDNRTYLWLHLALDEIRQTYRNSLNPDREELDVIPRTVFDAYEKILNRASTQLDCFPKYPGGPKKLIQNVLQIVVGARRPLSTSEMSVALSLIVEETYTTISELHLSEKLPGLCGHFIYVDNESRVHLCHQTAKEYLLRDWTSVGMESLWRFNSEELDRVLAVICLKVLLPDKDSAKRRKLSNAQYCGQNPRSTTYSSEGSESGESYLSVYARQNFHYHYRLEPKLESFSVEEILELFVDGDDRQKNWSIGTQSSSYGTFLDAKFEDGSLDRSYHRKRTRHFENIGQSRKEIANPTKGAEQSAKEAQFRFGGIEKLARTGHLGLVKAAFATDSDKKTIGKSLLQGMLRDAASDGHLEMTKFLVDEGKARDYLSEMLNPDFACSKALLGALKGSSEAIAALLLDAHCDSEAEIKDVVDIANDRASSEPESLVELAAASGFETITLRLLALGCARRKSLLYASRNGHAEVVKKLYEDSTSNGTSASLLGESIRAAASHRHHEVVKIHLEDANKGDLRTQEPLWFLPSIKAAAAKRYTSVFKELLEYDHIRMSDQDWLESRQSWLTQALISAAASQGFTIFETILGEVDVETQQFAWLDRCVSAATKSGNQKVLERCRMLKVQKTVGRRLRS